MLMFLRTKKPSGFTVVELIVIIVVVGILAALTIVAYGNMQRRAQVGKIEADLSQLDKAIKIARQDLGKPLTAITETTWTSGGCAGLPAGTDLAALPDTHACWTTYLASLEKISEVSDVDVRGMVDPWGQPYAIDENEGVWGSCAPDTINIYKRPYANNGEPDMTLPMMDIPLTKYSGCA